MNHITLTFPGIYACAKISSINCKILGQDHTYSIPPHIIFLITSPNCFIYLFIFVLSSGLRNFHQPPHTPYGLLQFLFSDRFTIILQLPHFFLIPNNLVPKVSEPIVLKQAQQFLLIFKSFLLLLQQMFKMVFVVIK